MTTLDYADELEVSSELLEIGLDPLVRLSRDLKRAAIELGDDEARYLVDYYYTWQEARKRAVNMARSFRDEEIAPGNEPHAIINWLATNTDSMEKLIKGALDVYADSKDNGVWCKSITGIGPVITAGLMAHIDITKAPTLGHIWRFAGLDPSSSWLGREGATKLVSDVVGRGTTITNEHVEQLARLSNRKVANLRNQILQMGGSEWNDSDDDNAVVITRASVIKALAKRPWNAELKTLCWKIGESFVKFQNHPNDFYGKLYVSRKAYEHERNNNGQYAQRAAQKLIDTNIRKREVREVYESGMLTDGHIHSSAKRWVTKLFLAHFHHVTYETYYGEEPPKPYVLDRLGHVHVIAPPNWPLELD